MEIFAFLNWDVLATFSGAVGLTVIIVQMLKLPLDKVWKIPTRFLVYIVCLVIMLLAQYFIGSGITFATIVAAAINAVLGTLTAMALYEQIIALPEQKKLEAAYKYLLTGETVDEGADPGANAIPETAQGTAAQTTDEPA